MIASMFMQFDFPALTAGICAAVACAIVGCFLILRRMSLMGDAISHAVLPGIVGAFLLTDSLRALPVFVGCAIVGVLTAALSELIHRLGKVEPGASMGVVFTVLFAIGVVMLEQTHAHQVDLDPDCVLFGSLALVHWEAPPQSFANWFSLETWQTMPRQMANPLFMLGLSAAFIIVLFKELRITSFDPGLAAALGMRPNLMHYLLMTVVAMTTVAAFEAVGSILVVAMLIVPGLVAHLLTDRLAPMIIVSAVAAVIATAAGYGVAVELNNSAAGMTGLMLGAMLIIVGMVAPQHGWISRWWRRLHMTLTVAREDMLGLLYRLDELKGMEHRPHAAALKESVGGGLIGRYALHQLQRRGRVDITNDQRVQLTDRGRDIGRNIIRSHRLWEAYLVEHLGLRPDHVHDTAMKLEHITDAAMQRELEHDVEATETDPHGKPIP